MSDHDEYDAYDLSEFTSDELAQADADLARAHGGPALQIAIQDSPMRRFLSWKRHLAVTDLVAPLWCEVQHEYGLYGKRHRPLRLRPSVFTSRNGKQIRVHEQLAHANDRRLTRGRSVHKALEDELHPDKLVVRVLSDEERFGLRLLRLIDGFNQLVSSGITRELPVFAITHDQVVLGVIDEVLLTQTGIGQSPSASPRKGNQQHVSPQVQQISSDIQIQTTATSTTGAAEHYDRPTYDSGHLYELRILDYKTRRSENVPLDDDTLSPRLQLMMYHRMLSALLEPESLDFGLLWNRLNLNHTKPFSAEFLEDVIWEQRQADPGERSVHLNRLVSEWISTVRRKPFVLKGVSQQLQIVYRRSVFARKRREKWERKAAETIDVDYPLEALALQEELDVARAVEESLDGMGHEEAGEVAHHDAQNVKQVGHSFVGHSSAARKSVTSPMNSGPGDPALAWAIQQSLLTCAHVKDQVDISTTMDGRSSAGTRPTATGSGEESAVGMSPIIGTKEFRMDDSELDARLADVLQWWYGARPARGVDVSQTNRCFTCEYQDSCEWRAQKAREAGQARRVGSDVAM